MNIIRTELMMMKWVLGAINQGDIPLHRMVHPVQPDMVHHDTRLHIYARTAQQQLLLRTHISTLDLHHLLRRDYMHFIQKALI
jgi:hypothetical protein